MQMTQAANCVFELSEKVSSLLSNKSLFLVSMLRIDGT